ncbi:MAG TPA: MauE/DoxX family redox-associated membrane protein [Jatrophihabitans sp.]|nr:MauE/DoxX family redox-associated membrane protein [Jatrophihabitans sp.]
MTWTSIRPWLGTVVRLFLGAVWIWAALSKLGSPRTFTQAVRAYDVTPEWLSKAIGYGLPVLELCIGILLVVGIATRIAAIASAVLFVAFLVGIIEVAIRGIQLECGCFGGGGLTNGATNYTWDILRDIGLLILAAFLSVWSFTRLSLEEYIGRHDYVAPPSAKRMRNEAARRKYEAMIAARRSEARSRALYINASLVGVVVLVSFIGIGVQAGRAKIEGSLFAQNATVDNGVTFGKPAAATVDIYEDFQCPHCQDFELTVGKTVEADVRANKAQVHYHSLAFLDASSNGNRYSSRAANAALCASDISVDDFVAYHDYLYRKDVQPVEGTNGRTDAQLIGYAQKVGITGGNLSTFAGCVHAERHKALVQAITDRASQVGVNATPTIKVNGQSIAPTLQAFNAAVAQALKHGPAPNPSPSSSSSAPSSPVPSSSSAAPSSSASTSATKRRPSAKASASKKG